jgi:hypothetical protein
VARATCRRTMRVPLVWEEAQESTAIGPSILPPPPPLGVVMSPCRRHESAAGVRHAMPHVLCPPCLRVANEGRRLRCRRSSAGPMAASTGPTSRSRSAPT